MACGLSVTETASGFRHQPDRPHEEVFCQMGSIPTLEGFANSLPELMDDRLGKQGHGHLSVTDV